MPIKDLIVAIDLGGTNIRAALCNTNGKILARDSCETLAHEGPESVYARVVKIARRVVNDWARVRGIGLAAPGPLDPQRGVIFSAPNLPGMKNFAMKARLESEFHVPAVVGNDANVAALGEHRYGAGRGVANMIYMTISTGIGGGIIADNKLFLGARGFAGEIGHQTLDANGPRCNCGNIGCLEALASGPAIARAAHEAIRGGRTSTISGRVNGNLERITTREVTDAAREGDELAREIIDRAAYYVGLGIVNLLHNFDTPLFVLGGSVSIHAWDLIYPKVLATLDKYAMPTMRVGVRVLQAQLGDDAGLVGAAVLVLEQIQNS